MKDILFQLKNHTLNSSAANEVVMNRAVEILERHRALTIDMLAALSWLKAKDKLPIEINMFKLELNARELLDIEQAPVPVAIQSTDKHAPQHEVVDVIGVRDTPQPLPDFANIPDYKICPACGDRNAKIVHLKRRPRAGLECAACRYEYPFPHKWL